MELSERLARFSVRMSELDALNALVDEVAQLEKDYAMLQKGLCGTNAELSTAWYKVDVLKAGNKVLREWMRWILHLQSGVGKNGGPPSSDEWIECLEQGVAYLQEEQKEG